MSQAPFQTNVAFNVPFFFKQTSLFSSNQVKCWLSFWQVTDNRCNKRLHCLVMVKLNLQNEKQNNSHNNYYNSERRLGGLLGATPPPIGILWGRGATLWGWGISATVGEMGEGGFEHATPCNTAYNCSCNCSCRHTGSRERVSQSLCDTVAACCDSSLTAAMVANLVPKVAENCASSCAISVSLIPGAPATKCPMKPAICSRYLPNKIRNR